MGEVAALDDVGVAVSIDVEREIAEVVDVVVGVVDVAEVVLGPGRRFIPTVAGDDVELAVVVDVGKGRGFVVAGIDLRDAEGDVGGASGGEEGWDHRDKQEKEATAHGGNCRGLMARWATVGKYREGKATGRKHPRLLEAVIRWVVAYL